MEKDDDFAKGDLVEIQTRDGTTRLCYVRRVNKLTLQLECMSTGDGVPRRQGGLQADPRRPFPVKKRRDGATSRWSRISPRESDGSQRRDMKGSSSTMKPITDCQECYVNAADGTKEMWNGQKWFYGIPRRLKKLCVFRRSTHFSVTSGIPLQRSVTTGEYGSNKVLAVPGRHSHRQSHDPRFLDGDVVNQGVS